MFEMQLVGVNEVNILCYSYDPAQLQGIWKLWVLNGGGMT